VSIDENMFVGGCVKVWIGAAGAFVEEASEILSDAEKKKVRTEREKDN
jgi:hypothetical protein